VEDGKELALRVPHREGVMLERFDVAPEDQGTVLVAVERLHQRMAEIQAREMALVQDDFISRQGHVVARKHRHAGVHLHRLLAVVRMPEGERLSKFVGLEPVEHHGRKQTLASRWMAYSSRTTAISRH
jgi:hypothetical protein